MTAIILLKELKAFIEDKTREIILSVKPVKNKVLAEDEPPEDPITNRPADVYLMQLPDKNAETQRVPYILLQFLTGKDEQKSGETPESEGKVRIVVACYSNDGGTGAMDVLNVLTRIRIALLKAGQVGQFLVRKPLEYIVYPEHVSPYYLGEMLVDFEMPGITRELQFWSDENK